MEAPHSADSIYLDLDGAWTQEGPEGPGDSISGMARLDCGRWGPALRFSAPRSVVETFYRELQPRLPPFILYGSGDYHYLTAFWLRKIDGPFTLVSFDNHPDWDIRPPHWCCGSWISRALALPNLQRAVVWGCGNFELEWPNRLFANHRALREGRLDVRPWGERLKPRSRDRWKSIGRSDWREKFTAFARELAGRRIYVTVDIDCLAPDEAATNWENGLFRAEEIAWALRELRAFGEIAGGDLCGAASPPRYARFRQRFASTFDHPRLKPVEPCEAAARNLHALKIIWPALASPGGEPARDFAGPGTDRFPARNEFWPPADPSFFPDA